MAIFQRSPRQSSQIYAAAGSPRQRHVFLVRFQPNGKADLGSLTFVVKHADRPKVTPKTEELNQYNKRRQIYTGFKLDPVRVTFYDSAEGAAHKMWNTYAQYYFGDFAPNAASSYGYDMTTPFSGSNFGLSEGYGGATDSNSQWFFNTIEIFHFYVLKDIHTYDQYSLKNPRIAAYEPDELDHENYNASQITMQFVYENLQYTIGQPVSNGNFTEFNTMFAGNTLANFAASSTASSFTGSTLSPSNPSVFNLINGSQTTAQSLPAAYRQTASNSAGALASQGNFDFASASSALSAFGSGNNTFGALNASLTGTAQYGMNTASAAGSDPLSYLSTFTSGIGDLPTLV